MSGFHEKTQIFLIGLLLGLLVGGGFFLLKLDNYFRELSFYKNSSQSEEPIHTDVEREKRPGKNILSGRNNQPARGNSTRYRDSVFVENLTDGNDTTVVADEDSLGFHIENTEENNGIIFKRDELLAVRNFEVQNLDLPANRASRDSLLSDLAGIRENETTNSFIVEYWKSPINYKGYKMSRNKLVLYGISSGEPLRIFRLDDILYMKYSSGTYKLNYTDNFHQLEKEMDNIILARLNK